MEEQIYTLLAALGYPVAWGGLGQGTSLPRIALYRVSGLDDVTLDGRSGWLSGRVQVDCYAATYASAVAVSRAVTAALSGYGGGPVWFARLDAIRDLSDEEGGEEIRRVVLDFALTWRE